MTRKFGFLAILVLAVIVTAIACGGGGSHTTTTTTGHPASPSKLQAMMSALPGTHIFARKTTTTSHLHWSYSGVAYAQTSTIALSQSFNGVCDLYPGSAPDTAGLINGTVSGLFYRQGQTDQPACNQSWVNGDGSLAALNAQTGSLVIGDGTISNIVAYSSAGSVMPTGTTVDVFVLRNGSPIHVGGCTLHGNDYQKCGVTTSFAALDGDLAIAAFTKPVGDSFKGLNVLFVKQ